jgi:penicillin-binding protein-related factor A (putative recombinase)
VFNYVKTFKGYKTQYVHDLFEYIDYTKDKVVEYPENAVEELIVKSLPVVFLCDISETEYKGVYVGDVIKTDEQNTVKVLTPAYFLKSHLKILKSDRFKYHRENIAYIKPCFLFVKKEECMEAYAAEMKAARELQANEISETISVQKEPLKETTPPRDTKFKFDKERIIRNAWTSFKVGYAILRQENLPDNVLAALYELNNLRKRYRRMKPQKLKEIVAEKHGLSVEELGSALQSRVNYMKHAKHAFQKIWRAE